MNLALLAFLLATSAIAQQPQRIGDDQPLRNHIASLPATQRHAIIHAIEPTLWDSLGEFDDADQMQAAVNTIERDLRYDHRTFHAHTLTLVQAHDHDGCGAAHNCLFFILDNTNRILLGGVNAKEITILPTQHNALPDIRLTDDASTSAPTYTTYAFDGHEYIATK